MRDEGWARNLKPRNVRILYGKSSVTTQREQFKAISRINPFEERVVLREYGAAMKLVADDQTCCNLPSAGEFP